jgi:hypothetical protein
MIDLLHILLAGTSVTCVIVSILKVYRAEHDRTLALESSALAQMRALEWHKKHDAIALQVMDLRMERDKWKYLAEQK